MEGITNMKYILTVFFSAIICAAFGAQPPLNPVIAPGTVSALSATLLWDKPVNYSDVVRYHIFLNGKEIATEARCNYMIMGLKPGTTYNCTIKSEDKSGLLSKPGAAIAFTTSLQGKQLDIIAFGAKGDGLTINTRAIQKAINACPKGGIVRIPKGVFLSGALFLKSYMTLLIDKDATLKGSINDADYLPMINNRFEGWEMETYASLLNAGVMDHKGGYTVQELSIKGEGTISGGGNPLAKAMIDKKGLRGRGRLILLMNCRDVEIQGLHIENSPCWTIHYLYSKNVSLHNLNIVSTAHNGDGIDPDSSDDSYIFNCTFSTGDDCIAIKSGKNPDGYKIGKPTRNVRITDCDFFKGHGISIGSEMSGGVSGVLVRDCKAGALLHGMQIKGTKDRGGYVKDVTVADCQLQQITIFSAVNYNNDGEAAPVLPSFENYTFRNIDLSGASGKEPVIDINGFDDPAHLLKNVSFTDIIVPEKSRIVIKNATQLKFNNVKSVKGSIPDFEMSGVTDIVK
jgi:exo-poly-alpha-galacturonosidase